MCTEFNVQMTKPMPKQTVLQAQSALASAVSLNQMVSDKGTRLIIHSVGIPPLVFFRPQCVGCTPGGGVVHCDRMLTLNSSKHQTLWKCHS